MKIPSLTNFNYSRLSKKHSFISDSKPQAAKGRDSYAPVNFRGYYETSVKNGKPMNTWFYRDYTTLESALNMVEQNFPNGAQILDYACSDGEEAISIYSLLNNKSLYPIKAYDNDVKALEKAKRGEYRVGSDNYGESFLVEGSTCPKEKELKKRLLNVVRPIYTCDILAEYKIRKEVAENIRFAYGDIMKADKLPDDKKTGAIFFRNALYHVVDNSSLEILKGQKYYVEPVCEKMAKRAEDLSNKLVDVIYNKLDTSGVFVLGDCPNDLVYIASNDTPTDEKILFKETDLYKQIIKIYTFKSKYASEYYQRQDAKRNIQKIRENGENVYLLKTPPIYKALRKDGRFKPVGYTVVGFDGTKRKIPTVWQKVK